MKDIVLDFSIQENIRYILADDGNRYNFTDSEWGNEKLSQKGDNVDFEIDDYKNAFKMHILKE